MPNVRPRLISCYADPGTRKSVILPDGTKVRLNAGSELRYDADMTSRDTRNVDLSGEAYFDVQKDKERPFIIHTDKLAIRVLGTAFNVKAYPKDKMTETTLMQGSIELTVNSKPYQKIILKPREKFALIEDGQDTAVVRSAASERRDTLAPVTVHAVNKEKLVVQDVVPVQVDEKQYVREVCWVEDNFVFQNETLEEMAPGMERWFDVQISLDDQRIRSLHFTGVFHKETILQALQALQYIQHFSFKIEGNHVYIH
jgi:ferric-dicitrate binding protein FerR (iron transport regulator)